MKIVATLVVLFSLIGLAIFVHKMEKESEKRAPTTQKLSEAVGVVETRTLVRENPLIEERISNLGVQKRARIPIPLPE